MKKEEFLSFSLPYGLKLKCFDGNIAILTNGSGFDFGRYSLEWVLRSNKCKPILHPLYDLTKEIEHNGERFIPLHRLLERSSFNLSIMTNDDIMEFKDIFFNVNLITINELHLYLGWHFDIAGLIEKGEAIDVNTLNENPYK